MRHLLLASLLATSLSCSVGAENAAQNPAEKAPGMVPELLSTSQTSVGFATVDITWRAGAKPGQVGTDADIVPMSRLWRGIIEMATTAVRLQYADRGEQLLRYATDWTLDWLEKEAADLPYDKYSDVFQAGRGIHTPSTAKAMVAEYGGQKVAIVKADLYLMQRHIHKRVAELVAAETGLGESSIMIVATHNHSAADAAHTAAGIATLSEAFDPRHFSWITHKIAQAIIEADANRLPAKMSATRTTMRVVQRNVIGPATGQAIPPEEAEAVDVLAGYPRDYFDDDLFVLDFQSEGDERLGSVVVFAMHPESLDDGHGLLSSDFVGPTEAGLEARWQAPVMWLPGGLGDVEQDNGDNFGEDYWREDFLTLERQVDELVNFIAPILETEPLPTDDHLPLQGDVPVQAYGSLFPGPENEDSPTDTAYQWPVTTYLSEQLPLASARVLSESANLYLQVIRIGGVVIMGAPAELTTDLARHIRSLTNNVEGDLFDGYLWEDNPDWVDGRVAGNFSGVEMSSQTGFPMPVVISQANDYSGYVVTRWEFENRHHYRKSMTLFGPEMGNYIATRLQGLAGKFHGMAPMAEDWDAISRLDISLEQEIYDYVSGLDPLVQEFSRNIPGQYEWDVGVVTQEPLLELNGEMQGPTWHFAWQGSPSDLGNPKVEVEVQVEGQWQKVVDDSSGRLWLLYEKGGKWEALWHMPSDIATGEYRFKVNGIYRGFEAGVAPIDELWDPEGKNLPYTVSSTSFNPIN